MTECMMVSALCGELDITRKELNAKTLHSIVVFRRVLDDSNNGRKRNYA